MADFTPVEVKPAVTIDDFEKLDIRVGTIRAVHDVEGSKKLIRMEVDFGDHTRQILSGMREERDDLAALVGVQSLFLLNLEPRKMAGHVSEGMIVDIGYADRLTPCLAVPERKMPPGSRLG